jgi:hypothetical protein
MMLEGCYNIQRQRGVWTTVKDMLSLNQSWGGSVSIVSHYRLDKRDSNDRVII